MRFGKGQGLVPILDGVKSANVGRIWVSNVAPAQQLGGEARKGAAMVEIERMICGAPITVQDGEDTEIVFNACRELDREVLYGSEPDE